MPATAEQVAATALWVEQFTAASEQTKEAAAALVSGMWLSFDGWYDRNLVAKLARDTAAVSLTAQRGAAGISAAYIAQAYASLAGARTPNVPRGIFEPVRKGADPEVVHSRAAQVYLRAVGTGRSHQEALNLAGKRAANTLRSDIILEDRIAQQKMLDQLGIVTFRRIIRPELSMSGTCGLCVAASQKTYKVGELMPLHPPTCKCIVVPVVGDNDPGLELNEEDIGQLRADAGSNKAADLKRTRYTVAEHGELGPVLTKVDDAFRDQNRARLENDPARARRLLEQALPVLEEYQAREESGELYARERLDYQENLVAMLQRYAGVVAA